VPREACQPEVFLQGESLPEAPATEPFHPPEESLPEVPREACQPEVFLQGESLPEAPREACQPEVFLQGESLPEAPATEAVHRSGESLPPPLRP